MIDDKLELTRDEFRAWLAKQVLAGNVDIATESSGQLVIYTCMYEWTDGKFRSIPEPDVDPLEGTSWREE